MLDKKAIWANTVEMLEEAVGTSVFWTLVNDCYLDNIDDGVATVVISSDTMRNIVYRKAGKQLALALTEIMKRPIQVKYALGRPRLFETKEPELAPKQFQAVDSDKHELADLHERYGDIMGIVDNHPLFKKASIPVDKGGWGIFPQILTNKCKAYGVLAILAGLRFIANRPSVKNPRGLFFTCLDKGQFGYPLAQSANVIGPEMVLAQ